MRILTSIPKRNTSGNTYWHNRFSQGDFLALYVSSYRFFLYYAFICVNLIFCDDVHSLAWKLWGYFPIAW